ncbi:MAG TPA: sigma-70 family RNA polymerase sigma factor [Steroidobacteraceae bacterium]|jgi:RNA polymerase sigma-70 factor (ECF subfamily)
MTESGKIIALPLHPGDGAARNTVQTIVMRLDARLRAYLLRRTRNSADAADTVQEVYTRLTQVAESDPAAEFTNSYVFKTADSVVNDLFRRRRTRRAGDHVELQDDETLSAAGPSPYDEVRWRQVAEIMREAVHALPHDQRSVLLLHRVEGKSLPEVARMIGAPLRTVERRLALALATCRDRLEELGWFADE